MGRRRTGSIHTRGGRLYARITLHREPKRSGRAPCAEVLVTRESGAITPAYARAFAAQTQALYDAGQWLPTRRPAAVVAPETTVLGWVRAWTSRQTYTTASQDAARVEHYLDGSALASIPLARVRPADVTAWIEHARRTPSARGTPPAERTVRNAFDVLRRALARAVFDGLLSQDPCAVIPSDLTPRAEDARPERRRAYRLTRVELVALLSDDGIADDRLVLYHLLALTGARLGEITGLRWCDLSPRDPLAAVILAEQVDGKTGARRATKTRAVREVPVHPVLASVLAWWHAEGWHAHYGRDPKPVDLVVPARGHRSRASVGSHRRQPAVWREYQTDLAGAGIAPHRVHDLRHTFASLCADAGMAEHVAARWTHTAHGASARTLYVVPSWDRQCVEMARLAIRSGLAERVTHRAEASNV